MGGQDFIIIYREHMMMDCKPEKMIASSRDYDCEPLQLSYIVRNGNLSNHFEPSVLPTGAQGMLYRCEESESWVRVWIAEEWPVAVNDVFNFDCFVMPSVADC